MKFFRFLRGRFLLLIALFCIGFVFVLTFNYSSAPKGDLLLLDTGWQYWVGDLPEAGQQVPIEALVEKAASWKTIEDIGSQRLEGIFEEGNAASNIEVVWFKKQLPDSLWDNANPSIYFENIYAQSLEIYFDNEKIFERKRNWVLDATKVLLDLNYIPSSQVLYIKLESKKAFGRVGLTSHIYGGAHHTLMPMYVKKDFSTIVIGFVIALLGIIIVFCSLFIRKGQRQGWTPLGFIFLFLGLHWALSSNSLGTYYPSLEKAFSVLLDICKLTLPILIIYFFEQIFGPGYKLFIRRLWQVQGAFCLVSLGVLVLNVYTSFRYIEFLYFIKGALLPLFYLIEVLALVISSFYFTKKSNTDARIFAIGISCLLVLVILDIVLISINTQYQLVLYKLGILVFIISLASILGRRIATNYNQVVTYSKELETKNIELASMWKEVTSSRDQLAHLNHTLELRILERTEELEMANEELTAMNEELHSSNNELVHTLEILRNTQTKLIESEKMAALGNLVAGIAHEINTPVGVSVTAASYLQGETGKLREKYESQNLKKSELEKFLYETTETANIILANLQRSSELIQSFKQVAVDQSSEEKRKFKVKEYINEVLVSLGTRIKPTKHQIKILCAEGLEIESYPGALAQIITNLLLNSQTHAYHAGEEGLIQMQIIQEGKDIIFTYSDNGKGIDPGVLEKIFDPFFTTSRGQGGTGLGLHIVYNLVTQKLKGSIRCESTPGEGVHFYIWFTP